MYGLRFTFNFENADPEEVKEFAYRVSRLQRVTDLADRVELIANHDESVLEVLKNRNVD